MTTVSKFPSFSVEFLRNVVRNSHNYTGLEDVRIVSNFSFHVYTPKSLHFNRSQIPTNLYLDSPSFSPQTPEEVQNPSDPKTEFNKVIHPILIPFYLVKLLTL